MFASIRQFVHRNRRRVIVSSGILAVIYFSFGYIHRKFLDYQAKLTEERFSREQIRRRFEQTQKDALYTIYALVPVLSGPIFEELPVEFITQLLQQRRLEKKNLNNSLNDDISITTADSNTLTQSQQVMRKSKNELWSDLKSQSLTRLLTLIYSNALLILFTRLQLNILARREYLENALKIASNKHGFQNKIELIDKTNAESQQQNYISEQAYLSFSWWLLNRGWLQIKNRVKSAVDEVFEEINPRVELTLDEFSILLNKVQTLVESQQNNEGSFVKSVLLPPQNLETFVIQQILNEENLQALRKDNSSLRLLLDETANYADSSSSLIVLSSLVSVGISTFLNYIVLQLKDRQQGSQNDYKVKLAILLANTTKAANDFKNSSAKEYINNMDKVGELDELSASVYSNFEV